MIEQHVSHALELCDRVIVMEHGAPAWAGPAADATERVQAFLYAGTAAARPPTTPTRLTRRI